MAEPAGPDPAPMIVGNKEDSQGMSWAINQIPWPFK